VIGAPRFLVEGDDDLIRILRKLFRVSFDEKQLLSFWSVDAAPNSSQVDLHDAVSSYAERLCEPREQAVAVISGSLAFCLMRS
jgi:hypothetical protein